MDKKYFMSEAIKEAYKCFETGDIPVGAVIVEKNKIIAKGHNQRVNTYDVTNHAEIIAIRNAERKIHDWRLSDCDLYVTLEPCSMCFETIKNARIKNIYYLIENNDKHQYTKTNKCTIILEDINAENYKKDYKNFFKTTLNR